MLGTCGTLSWQLVEINLRLIVMWRYKDADGVNGILLYAIGLAGKYDFD